MSSHESPTDPSKLTEGVPQGTLGGNGPPSAGYETKRKYRRHPKPDENAPERPPSAYVIFSNKIREEVKEQNLSFTQIAKLVGDRWQKLDPLGKEPYEAQANAAKERYNIQLSAYKKTDAFKEYSQYLFEFKAKHGGGAVGGPSDQKKPKLDAQETSMLSTGSVSDSLLPSRGHSRGGSVGSLNSTSVTTTPTSPTRSQAPSLIHNNPHSTTSLPSRQITVGSRGGSPPPGYGRDSRWRPPLSGPVGQVSQQSSVSEESSAVRSDSDPLVRTASLSLSTPPTGTPPLLAHGDKSASADGGRPRFPGPPRSLPSYGSTASTHSQALPSPMGSDSSWRSRPTELRNYIDAGPPMQPPLHLPPPSSGPVTLPSFPPILGGERNPDFQHRTLPLPPLPRTSPTMPPGPTAPGRLPEPSSFPFGGPNFALRRESTAESPMERSESDAANTLAGLAASTSRPGSTPAPERRWPSK